MRLHAPYQNPKLERKRLSKLAELAADDRLRDDRARRRKDERLTAFKAKRHANPVDAAVAGTKLADPAHGYANGLRSLLAWQHAWVRPIDAWTPRAKSPGRLFASLLRHLLARFAIPPWVDAAFLRGRETVEQRWAVHVAAGHNLRTAPGLTIALTKREAHHAMLAPATIVDGFAAAIRWGQAVAAGAMPSVAHATATGRLARDVGTREAEAFWSGVIAWFARETAREPLFDVGQIDPLCDYLASQRFGEGGEPTPQPRLSMKGRTLVSLLAQTRRWHDELARRARREVREAARYRVATTGKLWAPQTWSPCGLRGFETVESGGKTRVHVRVVELLSSVELNEEGRVMRHCVGSYAGRCASGHGAIFSLRVGGERRVTIEAQLDPPRLVQARGPMNRPPTPIEERWLRAWTTAARLDVRRGVLR